MKLEDIFDENYIILVSEDGENIELDILDRIVYQGLDYIVAIPVYEDEDDELYILREEIEEEAVYFSVEDDGLMETLFNIFEQRNRELYNFKE